MRLIEWRIARTDRDVQRNERLKRLARGERQLSDVEALSRGEPTGPLRTDRVGYRTIASNDSQK